MNIEDELLPTRSNAELDCSCKTKLAALMMYHGFATGHGDTFDDLLREFGWQIKERLKETR